MGNFPIGFIGQRADLTYPYDYLGAGPDTLADVVSGLNPFGATLKKAEHPLVIVGQGALTRPDGAAVASLAAQVALGGKDDWNGYCVLHTAASRVGALDLGFVPGSGGRNAAAMAKPGALDVLFLLGADEIDVAPGAFVVYIGTHGDQGAHRADVILPGAAYPEKSGIYVNTEGRVQMAGRASFPPGDAREDWAILRALSDLLGHKLPYDSLNALRQALFTAHPHLQRLDQIAPGSRADIGGLAAQAGKTDRAAFTAVIDDFYLTNPIARASAIMAECSVIAEGHGALTAAE
jgi:NADH-quinone oxidoreductase subunit G